MPDMHLSELGWKDNEFKEHLEWCGCCTGVLMAKREVKMKERLSVSWLTYTPSMKILNLFYGYAFYKFTMLPKTVKICNCVTLTMCWLIHCIIYPNTKLLNQNETQLNKTKKIHPIMVNRHINYRSWLHKRSVQAKDVTSHWFSALSSDDIL